MNPQFGIPSGALAAPPRKWSTRRILWTVIPAVVCLLALFVVSLFYFAELLMHSSGAYDLALYKASQSPCVVHALGIPLEPGWFISGNVHVHNSDGEAELSIPVTGPRGKGTIHAEATKSAGFWQINSLDMEDKEGRIQLIPEPASGGCTVVNPSYH